VEFLTDHFSTYAFVLGVVNSTPRSGDKVRSQANTSPKTDDTSVFDSNENADSVGSAGNTGNTNNTGNTDINGIADKSGDEQQLQTIVGGTVLPTISPLSSKENALQDILRLAGIAVAATILVTGIACGVVLQVRKKGKKNQK
jgi:hypothetical protein